MLIKVISGGQLGADQAGLIAAKKAGFQTGGWVPRGCRTQAGSQWDLLDKYGMQETPESTYPQRTEWNVCDSDGTIRFASDFTSAGELLTKRYITRYGKPSFDVNVESSHLYEPSNVADLICFLEEYNISILNIAGNSERTSPGITNKVVKYLTIVFDLVKKI